MVWRNEIAVCAVLFGFKKPLLRLTVKLRLNEQRDVFLVRNEQALFYVHEVEVEFVQAPLFLVPHVAHLSKTELFVRIDVLS
jgi:hypothetical protein